MQIERARKLKKTKSEISTLVILKAQAAIF